MARKGNPHQSELFEDSFLEGRFVDLDFGAGVAFNFITFLQDFISIL
jgi:hypothetical protein